MATKTWYIDSKGFGGATTYTFLTGDISQIASGSNYTNSGWNVGRTGAGNYALLDNGSEVSRNSFSSGTPASSTSTFSETNSTFNNTTNDTATTIIPQSGITFAFPYNAVFDTGDWTLTLDLQAQSRQWQGGGGRPIAKFWKSYFNSNGTWTQTQIQDLNAGSGWILGSTVSNLSSSASTTSTITLSPDAINPNSGWREPYTRTYLGDKTEASSRSGYLTVELAWEITTAIGGGGANNNCDVKIMFGTNTESKLVSPNFRRKIYATQ